MVFTMLRLVTLSLVLLVLGVVTAAPLEQTQKDQLLRVKRSDAVVPEADTHAADDEVKTLDKKAKVEIEKAPAENTDTVSPDLVDDEKSSAENEIEAEGTGKSDEALPAEGGEETGKIDEIFDDSDKGSSSSDNDVTNDDSAQSQAEKEKFIENLMSEEEPESNEETPEINEVTGKQEDSPYQRALENYLYDYYYNPYGGKYDRTKRSASKHVRAVNAEQMGQAPSSDLKHREKRDLDLSPEELDGLLQELDESYDDAQEEPQDETGVIPYEAAEEAPMITEPIDISPEEEYRLEEEEEEAEEEKREADALLDYLYRKAANAYPEPEYGLVNPEAADETWEDRPAADDIQFRPIVHQGQPGLFIPVAQKRQYLSLVPGMRRKRNGFYPADDTLDGRWGAFIADQDAVKRADAYDRLYHLARALKRDPYLDY